MGSPSKNDMYESRIMRLALAMVYNLTLLVGTAYLVGWCDWSAWWFLFTALLLANGKE